MTRIIPLLLLAFSFAGLYAQDALTASGGEANGTGGTVSYSVGQVLYTAIAGNGGTIIQGVQQPFEIFKMPGVNTLPGITMQCIMYPNPVTEYVNLKVERQPLSELSYQLYSMQGELLDAGDITSTDTHIQMAHLGAATYLIRISQDNRELKAFKIIKK